MDTQQFLSQAIETARANLRYVPDNAREHAKRQCAREALQEAHSTLSQREFFAALDALGGQESLIQQLMEQL